ncbi:hypothetical protein M0802_012028 [Mischocyttarus mexicanus]|nr:hypothetical protein M0802_012028 [Mischocyttarus mexicanus]
MIPFRGLINYRTYNPTKLTKYGMLIRMLCESKSGYICNFEIYSGKKAKSCKKQYCQYWSRILVVGITYTRTTTIKAFLQLSYCSEKKHLFVIPFASDQDTELSAFLTSAYASKLELKSEFEYASTLLLEDYLVTKELSLEITENMMIIGEKIH